MAWHRLQTGTPDDFAKINCMFINCADFPTDKDLPCSHLGYTKVIEKQLKKVLFTIYYRNV